MHPHDTEGKTRKGGGKGYEFLIAKLRLVLFIRGFKRNSDPNASVVYPGNVFYLPCDCVL